MVNNCILCKASSRTADASVTFHVFPKNKDRRKTWLQAINMNQVAKLARLCSNHFKSTDFAETIYGQRRVIKETAIPSIIARENVNIDNKPCIKEQCSTKIQNIQNLENTSEEQDKIKIEECSIECYDAAKNNHNSLKRKSMYAYKELDIPLKNIRHLKNVNINEASKNPNEAKIVLEVAMETIREQQRKIRNLQSHIKKLKKQKQIGGSRYINCLTQDNTPFLHMLPTKAKNGIDKIIDHDYIGSCTENL